MKFNCFEDVGTQARILLKQKNYEAAVALYQDVKQQFPENLYDIIWNLMQLHLMAKKPEKSVDAFEQGLKAGLVFPIWKDVDFWKPLQESKRFLRIWQEHLTLKRELSGRADPQVQVTLPAGYRADRKYPLLLVLHGWNENMNSQKKTWHSPLIENDYILAFIQSSQVEGRNSYGWNDFSVGRLDIQKIYQRITQDYSVDEHTVVLGGFSQGGMMAVDVILGGVIPSRGFFLIQPGGGIPLELTVDKVRSLADRDISGTILTRCNDFSFREQQQMAEVFESAGLSCQLIVEPAGEHGSIADLSVRIDAVLASIGKRL